MNKILNFILGGRSGCGKGTQAKLLMEHFGNLYHISSGNLFRTLSKIDTDGSIRIREIVEKGIFPDDDIAVALWTHHILFNVKRDQGIIADGFPRRIEEAKKFDKFFNFLKRKENTFYLLIDVSREESFNRLTKRRICKKCGKLIPWVGIFKELKICNDCGGELAIRSDDSEEAINTRLDFYEKEILPVIRHYEKTDMLIRINGEQPIEDVFKEILESLKKHK